MIFSPLSSLLIFFMLLRFCSSSNDVDQKPRYFDGQTVLSFEIKIITPFGPPPLLQKEFDYILEQLHIKLDEVFYSKGRLFESQIGQPTEAIYYWNIFVEDNLIIRFQARMDGSIPTA